MFLHADNNDSESSLGAQVILLVLSCDGSIYGEVGRISQFYDIDIDLIF